MTSIEPMSADAQPDAASAALVELGQLLKRSDYRFTTVTPATHERVNRRSEGQQATNLRDVFGWSRPFAGELLSPTMLELMRAAGILAPAVGGWRSALRASTLNGELIFHSAYPTVAADAVFFGPDTYRFAAAIDAWLANRDVGERPRRAIDICAGAGPGAMVIARACPEAEVLAADINEHALALCRVNAALAGLTNVTALRSDLLTATTGEFDLIVANPPYLLDPLERRYRHGGGPLGGGLSLAILKASLARLAPGGTLLLYTGAAIVDGGDPLREAVGEIVAGSGLRWDYREIDPDIFGEELETPAYADADRIAAVVLTVAR